MSKKIILLDLGGVVFQSSGTSNEQVNWEVINQLNEKHGTDLNIGKDKFPDFLSDYNQITQQALTGLEFLQFLHDTLSINSALIELVRAYGAIIIVSDNYRENIAYLAKRYNFENWAIHQIYSYDYQMVKTNPAFFKRLLKELSDYPKEDMIFIDDSKRKLESAALHGIQGILFENNQGVKEGLAKWDKGKNK